MAGKARRPKHVPQRTCAGCRQVLPKQTMIRIVRTEQGVRIDPTGKARGRGAYLHNVTACWENGLRGSLARSLRTELSPEERQALLTYMDGLTNESQG